MGRVQEKEKGGRTAGGKSWQCLLAAVPRAAPTTATGASYTQGSEVSMEAGD